MRIILTRHGARLPALANLIVNRSLILLIAVAIGVLTGFDSAVLAQSAGPTGGASASEKPGSNRDVGIDAARATTSGVIDDTDAAATEGRGNGQRTERGGESILTWISNSSGPIGLVIALMSFYLIALVVWMAQRYRTSIAVPPELVRQIQDLLLGGKYNDAYQRLVGDSSFLAKVLASGVRKLPSGLPHAQRAMELANEDATMEMEHRTTYLATVGTLGPMIGLVGTVYGMILSFRVIAVEGASPQASKLAEGISTALFATLEGIAISIPAIFFYALFRNRIARLSLEVAMTAESLLEQFSPGVKKSASGPGVVPSPPAHAHPFAVNAAALAASNSASAPVHPALPGGS
jgi:biopolymer transport protein ExbB